MAIDTDLIDLPTMEQELGTPSNHLVWALTVSLPDDPIFTKCPESYLNQERVSLLCKLNKAESEAEIRTVLDKACDVLLENLPSLQSVVLSKLFSRMSKIEVIRFYKRAACLYGLEVLTIRYLANFFGSVKDVSLGKY
ncbi:MAG: hypothetical protein AB2809_21670 [Candidatus Thiodiazotropha sp.]